MKLAHNVGDKVKIKISMEDLSAESAHPFRPEMAPFLGATVRIIALCDKYYKVSGVSKILRSNGFRLPIESYKFTDEMFEEEEVSVTIGDLVKAHKSWKISPKLLELIKEANLPENFTNLKHGDAYYFVRANGSIGSYDFYKDNTDRKHFEVSNVFLTKGAAEQQAKVDKAFRKCYQTMLRINKGERLLLSTGYNDYLYCPEWDTETRSVGYDDYSGYHDSMFLFNSKLDVVKFVEECETELKVLWGVE